MKLNKLLSLACIWSREEWEKTYLPNYGFIVVLLDNCTSGWKALTHLLNCPLSCGGKRAACSSLKQYVAWIIYPKNNSGSTFWTLTKLPVLGIAVYRITLPLVQQYVVFFSSSTVEFSYQTKQYHSHMNRPINFVTSGFVANTTHV